VAALTAKIDGCLERRDPASAARAILEAESGALRSQVLRDRAFGVAAELVATADRTTGADATRGRLAARSLYAALFDSEHSTRAERDRAFEGSAALQKLLVGGNGAPDELVLRHKIAPGDRLWNLSRGPWKAAGVTVAPGFVLHLNGIGNAQSLRAGATLRVPREALTLLVRKSACELTVLLGGAPLARFPVGVGAAESTPTGAFEIATRLEKPDWYFNGRRIPYGHPDHLIGTRWMGFSGSPEANGIGIHGTNDASSVGKAVSMGCIRMLDTDVERLFDWVGIGTRVEVRD
jgi:hypothetical protein